MIERFKNKNRLLIGALFFFILIVYLFLGFGVTISNDATTNLEQITSMDILSRSSHFSFHLFGIVFYAIFSLFLGFSSVTSVEIMLTVFSLLGCISLYYVVKDKFNDKYLSALTVLIYAFSTGIFRFSIQAEYLIMVPSFALISLVFYARKYYFFSGLVFALGLLTSPFIFLFALSFLLYNDFKSFFSKKNYLFGSGFLSLYLIISYFSFSETVKGQWSYSIVFDYYRNTILKINYLRVAAIWVYGYLRSFIVVIPFIFIGFLICYKTHKKLFYIIGSLLIVHLAVAIPEARYGGYQLTMYPFIALLASIGLISVFKKTKTGVISFLILYLAVNFFIIISERKFNRSLRDTYVMLQNDSTIPIKSILFVYQASKPIKTIYAPKFQVVDMLTSYQEFMAENLPDFEKPDYNKITESNDNIYLVESGVSMPDDYVKLLFNSFVKAQGSKIKGFGMEKLQSSIGPVIFIKLKNFPVDVYRIKKIDN